MINLWEEENNETKQEDSGAMNKMRYIGNTKELGKIK